MRVRCISGSPSSPEAPGEGAGHSLLVDALYTVLGVRFAGGDVSYALVDGRGDGVPRWFPSSMFDFVDRRPSRYWRLRVDRGCALLVVETWADDPSFHEDLCEGDTYAVEAFRDFRRLLESEFPDPEVALSADRGAREPWIRCPVCFREFQSRPESRMVTCPGCRIRMRNPW